MSLSPIVETVVSEKVQAGEMFTAYDVTLAVRQRGHRVKHDEIKGIVHDYYGRGGLGVAYVRTAIAVSGGNPYLYHRSVDDPATYGNIRNNHVSSPTTIQMPPSGGTASSDDDDDDDDDDGQNIQIPQSVLGNLNSISSVGGIATAPNLPIVGHRRTINKPGSTVGRTVDRRGTLSIPTKLLQKFGFLPTHKVFAVASGNGVDLIGSIPPSAAVFGKYTVDRNGQVRITQSLLKRAGIGGKQYDVESNSTNVVVKLSK